jgi:hypothetical protein
MKENYAAKMALKTDAALREYVTGHYQYREEAVLAAFDELRTRGQPAAEEEALRPGLETAAAARREQEAAAQAEATAAENADVAPEEASGPELYSPTMIIIFSMLSILIGGVLMCLNLYRVGRKHAALGLVLFMIIYGFAGSAAITWARQQGPNALLFSAFLFNLLAVLVYIRWFWSRYIGSMSFRSRSVLVPILLCAAIIWGVQRFTPYILQSQPKQTSQQSDLLLK